MLRIKKRIINKQKVIAQAYKQMYVCRHVLVEAKVFFTKNKNLIVHICTLQNLKMRLKNNIDQLKIKVH